MTPSFVAFDLDGTVFTHVGRSKVSRRVQRALAAAHDAGAQVICASGRPWMMLGRDLLSAPWLDWRVGLNGSDVTDARNDHVILRPLAKEVALELVGTLRRTGCHWDAAVLDAFYFEYQLDHPWMRGPLANLRAAKFDLRGRLPRCWMVPTVVPYVAAADVVLKVEVGTPPGAVREEVTEEVRAIARRHGGLEVAPMDYGIELTSPGVDKGSGLMLLLETLGLDPSGGVVFGDAANDLPMCGKPWTFVAMGNAEPEIAAVADDTTDSVWDDGVATWLEAHL